MKYHDLCIAALREFGGEGQIPLSHDYWEWRKHLKAEADEIAQTAKDNSGTPAVMPVIEMIKNASEDSVVVESVDAKDTAAVEDFFKDLSNEPSGD